MDFPIVDYTLSQFVRRAFNIYTDIARLWTHFLWLFDSNRANNGLCS